MGLARAGPAFVPIAGVDGTTAAPSSTNLIDEDALFIGGQPAAADVQQGGFADCYMLAAVASLAASQPAQIQSIVTGTAQAATVNLYRNDGANNPVRTAISVDNTLLMNESSGVGDGAPVGAGFRVGPRPVRMEYWVEINGQTLTIFAERYYEAGMWAPLLEKGYASFAQQYGQYGGFQTSSERPATNPDGSARDGYDIISGAGGASAYAYGVLLGSSATLVDGGETGIAFAPGSDLVTTNLPVIRNLLAVTGAGMPSSASEIATVGISREEAVNRVDSLAGTLLTRTDISTYGDLEIDLNILRSFIATWRNETDEAAKASDLQLVQSTVADITVPGTYPVLADPAASSDFRAFALNAGTVTNLLSDSGGARRNVYAWHFYSVLGASFNGADGNALSIDISNYAAQATSIDAARSSVRLRNPHGRNEPDMSGTGPADGRNDGEFTMSLESFIMSFGHMQAAIIL